MIQKVSPILITGAAGFIGSAITSKVKGNLEEKEEGLKVDWIF